MNSKVYEVLDKITDSDDTTVGGGCASALSGAMAAGMLSMVAKLSKKKPVNFTEEQYDAIINELEQLNQQLQEGCVHDTEAYCMIVDAFKLPKGTDEEKAALRQSRGGRRHPGRRGPPGERPSERPCVRAGRAAAGQLQPRLPV